jgi:catechol 2,3-dioxygenase-like lactoylglutathione lyase family enzyme
MLKMNSIYEPEEKKALVMNITHLSLVSVPVADQQVAKTFYTQTLGFTVVRDIVEGSQRWVELAPNGKATTITLVTWFPEMAPGSLQGLVFDTDNAVPSVCAHRTEGARPVPYEYSDCHRSVGSLGGCGQTPHEYLRIH